jgi:small conductance mechanosensitive channel
VAGIASRAMATLIVAAESSSERYITAGLTLLAALVLVAVVHRAMRGRAQRFAEALAGPDLSPVVDTRLRFLRRVIEASIIVVGLALALAQFTSLDRLASTVLASSAIAAAVVGFAARQVLANAIAGVMLAITQPLRIGDLVTFEGETGTVEDVSLTYTWLRTGADARLIIPNERLAAGILRNDSIRSPVVALEVSLWLAPDADETEALAAVEKVQEVREARIAEITDTGIRLQVAGPPVPPAERLAREAELRALALRALREAGCRGHRGEP